MPKLEIHLSRRELIIVYALAGLLILEILGLVLLIYYARFPAFIALFIEVLRILSPMLFGLNLIFVFVNFLSRGQELILGSWKDYLLESFKVFVLSFTITLALIVVSSLLGALILFSLRKIYSIPTLRVLLYYLPVKVSRFVVICCPLALFSDIIERLRKFLSIDQVWVCQISEIVPVKVGHQLVGRRPELGVGTRLNQEQYCSVEKVGFIARSWSIHVI